MNTQNAVPRWASAGLLAIAACGLMLRLYPFLQAGGPLAWRVDYDEGVYFSSSALLFNGVIPYRDFVYVHPPGLLYFLGLTSAWTRWPFSVDPATAFAAWRVVATVVGAINIVLVGRLVMPVGGPAAALVAAALYASYPDAVTVERGAFLETGLNLACLALAFVWLTPRDKDSRTAVLAGMIGGAACAVKVLGGIWLLAAIASAPRHRMRSMVPRFVAASAASWLLLVAPLAVLAPRRFVEQAFLLHVWRPPDGVILPAERLSQIVYSGHLLASILAFAALVWMAVSAMRSGVGNLGRTERFFAVAALLTVVSFFATSTYWKQYNSFLAASECVLAGICAGAIVRRVEAAIPKRAFPIVVALLVLLAAGPSVRYVLGTSYAGMSEVLDVGRIIRERVPATDSVFTFDPRLSLAGGRLPPHSDRAPVIADPYGSMILAAVRGGRRYPNSEAAWQSVASQSDVYARLEASRFAVIGSRGFWQLSAEMRAWFDAHFVCVTPEAGESCLWERKGPPHVR